MSKDREKLSMKELLVTIKVHEIELKEDKATKKERSLSKAFKDEDSLDEVSKEEGSDEDELYFIARKIYSILKNYLKKFTKDTEDKSQVNDVTNNKRWQMLLPSKHVSCQASMELKKTRIT
ncbi:hypothetical protein CR513_22630, partial [Mucuna pruriens]